MAIIRVEHNKDNPYIVMNKTGLNDPRLSFKAKGLLSYLLSKPDDWEVYVGHLAKQATDGKSAVRSGLKELIKYGYAVFRRDRDDNGSFTNGTYTIYEVPHVENPNVDKPNEENQDILSNDSSESKDPPSAGVGEKTPERDFLGDVVSHHKKELDKNDERQRGYRDATEEEYRICQRVADLWMGGKLQHFARDIEKAIAGANYILQLHDDDLRAALWTIDEYHAAQGGGGPTITSPHSLRNVLPGFMAKRGQSAGPIRIER
jgi:hypothetical protein